MVASASPTATFPPSEVFTTYHKLTSNNFIIFILNIKITSLM